MTRTEPAHGTPLHIDDAGFVRVPEARCYRVLTDVTGWSGWWTGVSVRDLGDDRVSVALGRRPRRLRIEAAADAWRHDAGFTMVLDGDVRGTWEVWLEPLPAGTVVHHVVAARTRRGWQPVVLRRWIRRGLWDLKDLLEERARRAMLEDVPADVEGGRSSSRGTVS